MTVSVLTAPPNATRVVLVRHGHVEGITPPRFRGQIDLALTACGLRQAKTLRDYLSCRIRPTTVYTSPLDRCVRTGQILADPYTLATRQLAAFTDIHYGIWQGRSFEEVQSDDPSRFASWQLTPHLTAIPGGERLSEVAARVAGVMRMILAQHPGETVVLVGHDSVNRVLLLLALELPLSRFWHLKQNPCAISMLSHDDTRGWVMQCMNETAHLTVGSVAE
jgi:phosphoserine phosphatase